MSCGRQPSCIAVMCRDEGQSYDTLQSMTCVNCFQTDIAVTTTVCADFSFHICCWPEQCSMCACMFSSSIHCYFCLVQMAAYIAYELPTAVSLYAIGKGTFYRVWATITAAVRHLFVLNNTFFFAVFRSICPEPV